MLQGVCSRSPTPSQSPQTPATFGYDNLGGYFQSCEDCFVAGLRCGHFTAAKLSGGGGGGAGLVHNGDVRAASERHEWLVERMKESLAKIDCSGGAGKAPRDGA